MILQNRSTHPSFQNPALHVPGKDIWFRVVDYGNGHDGVLDRSTVFGSGRRSRQSDTGAGTLGRDGNTIVTGASREIPPPFPWPVPSCPLLVDPQHHPV